MNKIKNKRGDITITILVIGIIVVCFLALISFYMADLKTDNRFNNIGKMTKVSSQMERHLFGEKRIEIKPSDGRREHIYNVGKAALGWNPFSKDIVFEVKYYLP